MDMEQGPRIQNKVSKKLSQLRRRFIITGGLESIIPDLKLYLDLKKKHGNLLDIMVEEYGNFSSEELQELINGLEGVNDINN